MKALLLVSLFAYASIASAETYNFPKTLHCTSERRGWDVEAFTIKGLGTSDSSSLNLDGNIMDGVAVVGDVVSFDFSNECDNSHSFQLPKTALEQLKRGEISSLIGKIDYNSAEYVDPNVVITCTKAEHELILGLTEAQLKKAWDDATKRSPRKHDRYNRGYSEFIGKDPGPRKIESVVGNYDLRPIASGEKALDLFNDVFTEGSFSTSKEPYLQTLFKLLKAKMDKISRIEIYQFETTSLGMGQLRVGDKVTALFILDNQGIGHSFSISNKFSELSKPITTKDSF